MEELKAEGEEKGEDELDKRLAVVKELDVGRFIVEIDGDRAVFACRFGGLAHVSSPCRWLSVQMRHGEGNPLQEQAYGERIGASPLNPMECGCYHPHLHVLATSGGYDAEGARWEHLQYLPYDLLRRKWQWHLLSTLRKTLATDAIKLLVDGCFRKYPNGLVTNVQKGQVPSQYQSVARYVAKYVVSPPISVRRIDRYDGARVTYHYRSHRTGRMEHETVPVDTFIGRMVQHTMPKGFKRIRYYGVQATKTFAKVKVVIQAALAKVEGVVKGAVKIIARLTYRQRYEQSTGRDPLRCPHCQGEMGLWRIWHPTYGVIYDEGEVIKRGTYASIAQRAGP